MKNLTFLTLTIPLFILGCASGGGEETTESTTSEPTPEVKEIASVCIWDKVSVRETPNEKGKWITSLSIGEKVTYTNISEVDSANDRTYLKIKLTDGTEGWSRDDFIIPESRPAVFVSNSDLYNRPDLLTKSDKQFSVMDIVAVEDKGEDGWAAVNGKRKEGKWIDNGWVKSENLSYNDVDLAAAKFVQQAMAVENPEEKLKALQEVANNSDLAGSIFIANVEELLNELAADPVEESTIEADSASVESSQQ